MLRLSRSNGRFNVPPASLPFRFRLDRLGRFCETFGDRSVRVLRTDEIEDWLHGLNLSPARTNNYAVRVGSMFSYGVKRHYLEANPFATIAKVTSDEVSGGTHYSFLQIVVVERIQPAWSRVANDKQQKEQMGEVQDEFRE